VRVTADLRYDADPQAVFEMLTDKAFQDRKLARTGALTWEVQIRRQNGGAVILSRRTLPTDQVPDAFRALIGPQLSITQTETWGPAEANGSRTGTIQIEVTGAPIRMQATASLSATITQGCVEQVDGELKARIPFIGGKVERSAEPAVRAALEAEQRIGRDWLAQR